MIAGHALRLPGFFFEADDAVIVVDFHDPEFTAVGDGHFDAADDEVGVVREQRRRIEELEAQVDYLTKRFRAAKQAANWLETRFRLRWQDSYGT